MPETLAAAPDPHRVTVFLPDLAGGGAERSLLRVAGDLAARGVDVELVLAQRAGPLVDEVPEGLEVVDLGCARVRSALLPLRRHLRRRRPTHLLATLEHAVLVGAWAIRLAGTPTVLVPRAANTLSRTLDAGPPLDRLVQRLALRVYRRAAAVVAVSEGVADDLVHRCGVPAAAVHVVPNPVVTPELLHSASQPVTDPWFADGEPPVVVGMGRLNAQKNFALLVDAWAATRQQVRSRLIILGEGELRDELDAQCRRLGVSDDVSLPGFVDDPFAIVARAGVFVLSSDYEGLPGALIQAMACGAPLVATDCPSGPREVLEGGRHGQLVPVGDRDAMSRAIVRALTRVHHPAGSAAWARYTPDAAFEAYGRVLDASRPATDAVDPRATVAR